MDNKEMYHNIEDFLQNLPQNFSILEEEIDIETQLSYFEFIKKNKLSEISSLKVEDLQSILKNPLASEDEKKKTLIFLASMENVKAFRYLESFKETAPQYLQNWTSLALQESRMLLESFLSEEKKIFISSGMGGKGHKLRYFIAGFLKKKQNFDTSYKKILKQEFEYQFSVQECEIETLDFIEEFVLLSVLIPIKINIKLLLETSIEECKTLGMPLNDHFLVTNVKKMTIQEIRTLINKQNPKDDFLDTLDNA